MLKLILSLFGLGRQNQETLPHPPPVTASLPGPSSQKESKQDPSRTLDEARDRIERYEFDEPDLILEMFRPAVVLEKNACNQDEAPFGSSRFGGDPDLPEGTDWPRKSDGKLLTFLAQINIDEFRELLQDDPDWPESGLLSFFGDVCEGYGWDHGSDGDCFFAMHTRHDEPLSRVARPTDDTHQYEVPSLEHARYVVRDHFLIPPRIPHYEGFGISLREEKRLRQLNADSCGDDRLYNTHSLHILGGCPIESQEGALPSAVAAFLSSPSGLDRDDLERWRVKFQEACHEARDWKLILQIGSCSAHSFGCDDGNIFFFAHKDDLRDGSLKRCWAIVDGS